MRIATATILTLATLVGTACIKRGEVVLIRPDASAMLVAEFAGDLNDVRTGSAAPSDALGWATRQEREVDNDGKETLTIRGSMLVPAGAAFPETYAAPNAQPIDLHFPTSVTVEKTREGTYYHFRRTYLSRRLAQVDYAKRHLETDEIKKLGEKDPTTLTDDERRSIAKAFLDFEADRTGALAELACGQIDPPLPQIAQINIWRRAREVYLDDRLLDRATGFITSNGPTEDSKQLEQELKAEVVDEIERAALDSGLTPATASVVLQAYDDVLGAYEITEDIADESWTVGVAMPGRIVAHNTTGSDSVAGLKWDDVDDSEFSDLPGISDFVTAMKADDVNGGYSTVSWEFDGKALHDRYVMLMATSFVPATPNENANP